MARRLDLQTLFEELLGSENVYFQPPPDLKMSYPAIVYGRDSVDTKYANNFPYKRKKRYQVTIIDRNPDSVIPDKVGELPFASFVRTFATEGLNHDVYNIFW